MNVHSLIMGTLQFMRVNLLSLLVLSAIAPSIVAAKEDVVIPSYAQLETKKEDMVFEHDVTKADAKVDEYDDAISKLKDDNTDSRYSETISDLKYAKKYYREVNGLPMFSFLGGPAFTPEQGVLVAVGGLYSFKTDREQQQLQRSSVSAFIIGNYVDSEVGYGLRAKHDLFWNNDDIQFQGAWNAGTQGKHYWGIGYDAAQQFDFGDVTQYKANTNNYKGNLIFRIVDNWFAGPAIKLNYFSPTTEPESAILDENFNQFKDKPFTWGLGGSIQYDSRDVAVNPWSGSLFRTEVLLYSEALGSQAEYQKLDVEYRTFHSFQKGRVLAVLGRFQQAFGDTPYYDMPELGGANSMRGYYQGQYRDKVTAEVTAEYRHTFRRSSGALSNHGVTAWTGVGSVGESVEDLSGHAILSYGIGYRYELQPRMNIRLDLGMGKHGSAFYFNFTEAF
ncbi:BamA/TamA family outer membrane protein [Vibrio barjaei]|uniref:BamA/TamA family outer membrane protein n=1 Tax=Vibrio barjaei TaxID=1676683 RepID=UPI0022837E1C|nr:BamA/TamA family outer membrane protein [Vibrio barjaei]MCY9869763.1 BamA/TamA family outer membrane protein [Vibrio barjaei]